MPNTHNYKIAQILDLLAGNYGLSFDLNMLTAPGYGAYVWIAQMADSDALALANADGWSSTQYLAKSAG